MEADLGTTAQFIASTDLRIKEKNRIMSGANIPN
jgi:hypothetical protein